MNPAGVGLVREVEGQVVTRSIGGGEDQFCIVENQQDVAMKNSRSPVCYIFITVVF